MSFLSDIFSWLGDLLNKLWDALGPLLAVLAIVFIAFAPYLAPLIAAWTMPAWLAWLPAVVTAIAELGPIACAIGGLGLAYIIDPDTTSGVVTGAAELVGSAVGTVAGAVVAGTAAALSSSPLVWLAGAALIAYFLLSDDGDKQESRTATGGDRTSPRLTANRTSTVPLTP